RRDLMRKTGSLTQRSGSGRATSGASTPFDGAPGRFVYDRPAGEDVSRKRFVDTLEMSARRRVDQRYPGDEARGNLHLRRRNHLFRAANDARDAAAHQLRRAQTADDSELERVGANRSSNHWDLSCFREG